MNRLTSKRILVLVLFIFTLLAIRLVLRSQTNITVLSTASLVLSNSQQQFTVSEDSANNPTGIWSASCGSIDQNGMYTAPSVPVDTKCTISFTNSLTGKVSSNTITVIPTFDGPAQLPIGTVKSSLADTPAPNAVTLVSPLGLQAAINNAKCGDTLQLQAGSTFHGNYSLPAKDCDDNHWVVIRTTALDSLLPPEGTRINPCYADVPSLPGRPPFTCPSNSVGTMAKIVANKGGSPVTLLTGANHYRIGPGLEITRAVGDGLHYGMISKQDTPADHIVVDRDWVHGTARDETVRGVYLGGIVYAAVKDSYINDFHCTVSIGTCVDSQAIAGGIGVQPQGMWDIENNFVEAAAETILFGGGGGTTVPTDITIRHNHMFKPLTWMPGNPNFIGAPALSTQCTSFHTPLQCPFIVKNLFELKNAQRLLLEGNILENVWAGFTQYATAIPFQALNQTGSNNPNTTVSDITVRYNRIARAANAFSANIVCLGCTVNPAFTGRISVHDDIFDELDASIYGAGELDLNTAKPFQFSQCPTCTVMQDISIDHVTVLVAKPKTLMVLGDIISNPIKALDITNSIVSSLPGNAITANGNATPCAFSGTTPLIKLINCIEGGNVTANALIGATSTWPAGNYFPLTGPDVGFTNYNNGKGGDYTLLSTSPYKGKGTDGKDIGADVAAVNAAIAGVN